jgi:FdhD protein
MYVPIRSVDRQAWRGHGVSTAERTIPEETAVALTYNGGTYAVMMATPQDLADFAVGFSLSEGLVQSSDQIASLDIVDLKNGIELRMWLAPERAALINGRRRQIAGPTGCGLCGVDSIAEALQPPKVVPKGGRVSQSDVMNAMQSIAPLQQINRETRAVHAAAFWTRSRGVVSVREDVGRHNALDKLHGALKLARLSAGHGMVLLTSRVSVEMVQKTAALGSPIMVAVSAPTALAVRMAEAAGITLIGVARGDGFEVFTHPERVVADVGAKEMEDVA